MTTLDRRTVLKATGVLGLTAVGFVATTQPGEAKRHLPSPTPTTPHTDTLTDAISDRAGSASEVFVGC